MAEEDESVGLHISKPYRSGLKRGRIAFVSESREPAEDGEGEDTGSNASRGSQISDFYLSLVLPSRSKVEPRLATALKDASAEGTNGLMISSALKGAEAFSQFESSSEGSEQTSSVLDMHQENRAGLYPPEEAGVEPIDGSVIQASSTTKICSRCKIRVTDWKAHVRTTVHMAAEEHSKPPHHLNRQSEGYRHMVGLGWDPDGEKGLGVEGQGIRFPIKAQLKQDNLGIGAKSPKSMEDVVSEGIPKRQKLLTAKQSREREISERDAREDLHQYLRDRQL